MIQQNAQHYRGTTNPLFRSLDTQLQYLSVTEDTLIIRIVLGDTQIS